MRIRPYRTSDDRIEGVVLMLQDITEKRAAERAIAVSEERLRLLLDSLTDYAIFTMSSDGVIDSWSIGAERVFGFRAEEIVGRPFALLFTAEDRESGIPAIELERAQRDGRTLDERYQVRANGTQFYASGVTTRLGKAPESGFVRIARDLTAQQEAADALHESHIRLDERVAERTRDLQTAVVEQQSAQKHVVNLLRRVVTAQEDERGRIARNLHDQLGQRLTALRLSLERLHEHLAQKREPLEQVDRALELTSMIDTDVGFLSWELRPAVLDHLGLGVALPRYVREWADHYGIEVESKCDSFSTGRLTHEGEVTYYRIAQEALTNVAKHAHASRVDVMLESRDDSVLMVVEDDGVGFDPSDLSMRDRGVGLLGMRERAALIDADFQIESNPGDGTSIFVRYPGRNSGAQD
jgi:PAS domain S-box-containing protein